MEGMGWGSKFWGVSTRKKRVKESFDFALQVACGKTWGRGNFIALSGLNNRGTTNLISFRLTINL